jgi:hypothetical protein
MQIEFEKFARKPRRALFLDEVDKIVPWQALADLGREPAPDETTILNFRHHLEAHGLGRSMLLAVNEHLAACGIRIAAGSTATLCQDV